MLWYYHSLADKFRQKLSGQLVDKLHEIIGALERADAR
jgi:hypothetical protein